MVAPLRHRQTKEAETDMFDLQPPRHISTLHRAAVVWGQLYDRYQRGCGRETTRESGGGPPPLPLQNLDGALNMKLYVTYGSPYARLARIIVIEKALEDRLEIIEAKTRVPGSPYYQINPSGRVPYLVDDTGVGMEDSQLICAYLDGLDGKPRFHNASHASDRAYLRLEFAARSMCDGIAVWGREMARPA